MPLSLSADAPRRLGRFEVLHELARGGMGVVYLGRYQDASGGARWAAIKTCLPELQSDPAFVAMFLDEARITAQIQHPCVVSVLEAAQDGEALYLAMEYVEGVRALDFARAAQATGGVPLSIALRILVDLLEALEVAHTQRARDGEWLRIVHRDVSPQNVLCGFDGRSRLIDFGVARASQRQTHTIAGGPPKGKLSYMSPEQVLENSLDLRSDLFSAGVLAWELFTGRRLFDATSVTALVAQVLDMPIVPPSKYRAGLPPALDYAVMTALQRSPALRPPTAAALADLLRRCTIAPASDSTMQTYMREILAESHANSSEILDLAARVPRDTALFSPAMSEPKPAVRTVAFYLSHADDGPNAEVVPTTTHGAARVAVAIAPESVGDTNWQWLFVALVLLGLALGTSGMLVRRRARMRRDHLLQLQIVTPIAIRRSLPLAGYRDVICADSDASFTQ
ncbi:MAG: serine/threonine-protein kinase [Deltaproteobacteria bacterium]|nr:serine/threonine-protein kinase [Deltaproteobacteria bacterium]